MLSVWDEKKYTKVLSDLVAIRSHSGEETAIADYVEKFLRKQGVPCERDKEDNVVAVIGKRRPALHVIGHLDTVPPVSRWESDPYKPVVKNGRLYGLGSSDMKSGIAVMLNLAALKPPDKGSVHLDFTVVEENSVPHKDNGARRIAAARRADVAITLEPTVVDEGFPQLEIGCQGSYTAHVISRGASCHSSVPWKGRNALYVAARLLLRVEKMNKYPARQFYKGAKYKPVISATVIRGGTAANIIPDRVDIAVNRRTGPHESRTNFERDLKRLISGLDAVVESCEGVDGAVTDVKGRLLAACKKGFQRTFGREPVYRFAQGRTDAVYFKFAGADVITVGPGTVGMIHREGEWVGIRKMPETAALMANVVEEYFGS